MNSAVAVSTLGAKMFLHDEHSVRGAPDLLSACAAFWPGEWHQYCWSRSPAATLKLSEKGHFQMMVHPSRVRQTDADKQYEGSILHSSAEVLFEATGASPQEVLAKLREHLVGFLSALYATIPPLVETGESAEEVQDGSSTV